MKNSITIIFAATLMAFALQAAEYIRPTLISGKDSVYFRIKPQKTEDFNCMPREKASVKFNTDKNNLYFYFDLTDDDVICEATSNQSRLQSFGDALQIFLKADQETFLWEFMIAPNGKKSCFFHPGAGMMFYPEVNSEFPDFPVENIIADGKWQAKVSIPKTIFKEKGIKFDQATWNFMLVRYNFSRYQNTSRETSCYPQTGGSVSNPDFFGKLRFIPSTETK